MLLQLWASAMSNIFNDVTQLSLLICLELAHKDALTNVIPSDNSFLNIVWGYYALPCVEIMISRITPQKYSHTYSNDQNQS